MVSTTQSQSCSYGRGFLTQCYWRVSSKTLV